MNDAIPQEGSQRIHAVVFQSGPDWVAQCLEYDIATQASSLDSLLVEIERILAAHIAAAAEANHAPFDDIPKAPRRFWEMYEAEGQVHITWAPAAATPPSLLQAVPALEAAWARQATF